MKSIWQGIPVLVAICGLLCAADGQKPKANTKKTAPAEKAVPAPAMVIERQPEDGPAVVPPGNARGAVVQNETPAKAPVMTEQVLPNGLVMVTSSEGFMSTVTVTKKEDGTAEYKCDDPTHSHSAPAKAPAGAREAVKK